MPTIAKCLTALGDTADAYQGEIDQYVAEGRGPREATIAALTDARNALKSERDGIVAKASKPKPLTWGDLTKEQRAAVEDAAQKMADERAKLSLAMGHDVSGQRLSADFLQARLDAWSRDWQGLKGYTFRAVASEAELPLAARSEAAARRKDASRSRVKAVFIPGETRETGELVFVASAFRSPREALATLMHEAGLHAGIRRLMGPALDQLLDEVAGDSAKVLTRLREIAAGQDLNLASREGSARAVEIYLDGRDASDQTLMREVGVARAAIAYGYDLGNANQRRAAAEEWLAHLAETHEDMALLRRIYAAIRRFLRELGVRVRLRNVDIDYILMSARRAAQEGPGRQALGMRQAYGPGATTYRAGGPREMVGDEGAVAGATGPLEKARRRLDKVNAFVLANDGQSFSAPSAVNGGTVMVTPSAKWDGRWQVTYFDAQGEPQYDSQETSYRAAVEYVARDWRADLARAELGETVDAEALPSTITVDGTERPTRNHDIRFSIGSDIAEDLQGLMDRASAAVRRGDRPRGKNLNFLNRTVGTPFHLSKKFPQTFGRFFAKLLDYHNEATNRAIEAERLAPSLFVNLEEGIGKSWGSSRKVYRATKRNRVKPVADAINESTLQERVMSVDELRQRGLDDDQIGTYNQALRAAHHSLDSTAQTFQVMALRGLIDWLHQGDKSKDRRKLSARIANSIIGSNVNEAMDIAVDIMQPDIDALKEGISEANGLLKDARKELENATQAKDNQRTAQAKQTIAALNDRIRLNTIALDKIGAPSRVTEDGKVIKGRGTIGQIEDIAERVTNLKSKGYFPLMRFGRFTVTVWRTDPETGKREAVWFSKHETETDQRIAYDTMLEEAGADEDVTMGTSNEDQWRLFQGVNMETLQLFADAIDGSTEQGKQYKALMQEHIRLGKAEHNALKRMLKRKGTAGYSDDVQRVLASYLVSNSRLAAGNLHSGDVTASILEDIPQKDGDLRQYATKLYTYLREPREEFSGTRNFMFMWYLGGSAASAIVNLSQVPMVSFPYLSIRGGIRGATAELTKAYAQVAKGIGKDTDTSAFGQAVRRAQLEGVLSPQQIYELQATARGGGLGPSKILNNPIVAFGRNVWGSLFSAAETINREVTFAAAWNIAKKAGDSDQAAYQYALDAVEETQYIYNRMNRPTWGRGIGAPLMTFKSFTIQTLELWSRLPPKQKALMGALLIAASGLTGLPGEEDLEDLWDTIARMFFGKAYPSRQALEDAVYWALGESIGNMVMRGVLADMPGDIGSRLGFGDIIPGTGLAMPGQIGGARELAEVVGPISGIAQDVGTAAALAGERDFSRAAYALMPRAIKNAIDGAQAMMTGEAVDKRGRAITDVSPIEGMLKATGINPTRVARLQETKWRLMRRDAYRTQMESAMANRLARALADRDREAVAEARQEIRDWNRRNPSDKIVITRGQIRQRMKTLRLLGNERFLRSMSPELRAEAARALAEG